MSKKPAPKSRAAIAIPNHATITLASSSRRFPADWKEQILEILGGMRQKQLDLGEGRTAESLQFSMDELIELDKQISQDEAKMAQMRDARKQMRLNLWLRASGIRTAVAGIYGKDSLEYQAVGGTRQSERKRHQRKKSP